MLTKKVTQTELQRLQENKAERIRCNKKKNAILKLDEAWNQFALIRMLEGEDIAFTIILKNNIVKSLIDKTANRFYKAWKKNSRVTLHDFESVLYEKAWKIIDNYSSQGKWYLYEQLNNGFKQACIDFLRIQGLTETRININTYYHSASSITLNDDYEVDIKCCNNTESDALINVWIEKELEEDEGQVAKLLIKDHKATLGDICLELGLDYRQQSKRILDKIKMKIQD